VLALIVFPAVIVTVPPDIFKPPENVLLVEPKFKVPVPEQVVEPV
jgi:hypothetical protein